MARKRMIDPSFWTDEKLGLLTPMHRLLFMGLISNADDEGRLQGHPALVKSLIFPYDIDITHQQVEEWLFDLHKEGLILIYEVGKQRYIWIPNFLKYQQINRPTPSKLPAPPENIGDNNSFTEDSLNNDGGLTEDSLRTHSEKNRIEKNRKEIEEEKNRIEDILSSDETDDTRLTEDSLNNDVNETINVITPKEVVELYNSICVSLPKVVTISEKRRKQIKALLKKIRDRTEIEVVFRKAEESDFLSGRSGKWNGCNFDWLINYNNFLKVLEGTYDNKETKPKSWNVLERLYKEELEKEEMNSE